MKMNILSLLIPILLALSWSTSEVEGRRKRRCKLVSPWTIGGGNPVMGNEGFTTVMYILSKSAHSNAYQLGALDNYGYHYKHRVKQRVRMIALNPVGYPPVTQRLRNRYRHIRIFQEPDDGQRIFKRLGGYERDMLIYDECSRLAYQYGFPYSYMGFPWVSKALTIVINHHDAICGPCVSQQAFLAGRMAKALVARKKGPDGDKYTSSTNSRRHNHSSTKKSRRHKS